MASQHIRGASGNVTPAIRPGLRRIFTTYDREQLSLAITVAIDLLDILDGDPDQDAAVDDDPRGCDPEEDLCAARDDGCGAIYMHGSRLWGADLDDSDFEQWRVSPTTFSRVE